MNINKLLKIIYYCNSSTKFTDQGLIAFGKSLESLSSLKEITLKIF